MKKLITLALFAVIMAGCYKQNPSGKEQIFIVIKMNNDTLNIRALKWHWDGRFKCCVFESDKGNQYVSDVKDIILKEE